MPACVYVCMCARARLRAACIRVFRFVACAFVLVRERRLSVCVCIGAERVERRCYYEDRCGGGGEAAGTEKTSAEAVNGIFRRAVLLCTRLVRVCLDLDLANLRWCVFVCVCVLYTSCIEPIMYAYLKKRKNVFALVVRDSLLRSEF